MQRIAMIEDNVVHNIAVWDGVTSWSPLGYTLVNIDAQPQVNIGWLYNGETQVFSAPPPEE